MNNLGLLCMPNEADQSTLGYYCNYANLELEKDEPSHTSVRSHPWMHDMSMQTELKLLTTQFVNCVVELEKCRSSGRDPVFSLICLNLQGTCLSQIKNGGQISFKYLSLPLKLPKRTVQYPTLM